MTQPHIDPRIKDWITVEATGTDYKLLRVEWRDEEESGGRINIYVDVLDGLGQRMIGVPATLRWPGGSHTGETEEKPGDPGGINFPMGATLGAYSIQVGAPGESDVVHGLGLGTPEQPAHKIHTSFVLEFGPRGEPEPEPQPEPEPGPAPKPEPQPEPPPGSSLVELKEIVKRLDIVIRLLQAILAESKGGG